MSQFIEMFENKGYDTKELRTLILKSFPGEWGVDNKDGSGVKVIRTTNITNEDKLDLSEVVIRSIAQPKLGKKKLVKGDILLERSGGTKDYPVGRVAYFESQGIYVVNNFTQTLRCINGVESKYVFYFLFFYYKLNKMQVRSMGNQTTGIQNLNMDDYMQISVIVPPIETQKQFLHIVKQADKSKFIGFKSQFIEMFGNPNRNTKGFNQYAISDIFDLQMGKTPERDNQNYWNKGVNIWISISDMQDDCKYVGDSKEYITDMAVSESGIKIIPQGTLLMSFKLTIGRVAIADKDIYTNEAIMAFKDKCVVELSQQWLYNLLTQYDWLGNASQAAKGKTLNKEIIGRSIVSIPPIEMQEEFATIVQQADKSKYIN